MFIYVKCELFFLETSTTKFYYKDLSLLPLIWNEIRMYSDSCRCAILTRYNISLRKTDETLPKNSRNFNVTQEPVLVWTFGGW